MARLILFASSLFLTFGCGASVDESELEEVLSDVVDVLEEVNVFDEHEAGVGDLGADVKAGLASGEIAGASDQR